MQDPLINFQRNYEFKKLTVGLWAPIQYINSFFIVKLLSDSIFVIMYIIGFV